MLKTSIRSRFIFTVGTNLFRSLLSFITGILLARLLGPESYGNMAFLMGSFMGVLSLLNMGSSSAFFTFMSQKTRSRKFVLLFFLWIGIQLMATLIVIGLFFPVHWIENIWLGQKLGLVLLAFLAIFMQGTVWSVIQQAAESQKRTYWAQSIALGVAFIHLLSVILLWLLGWLGLYAIFIAILIEYFVAAIIVHKKYTYTADDKTETINTTEEKIFKKYLNYCLPLVPYSWVAFAYIFADRWLLQYYSGSVEQAYYSVAAQFAAIALIFTTSILRIFWKEISEAQKQGNNERVRRLYKKVSRLLFFISAFIAGFLIPWSEVIVSNVLGENYKGGVLTLAIMFVYPVYQSMGQIGGTMLYATERVSIQSIIGVVFMIASMIATYLVLAPSSAFVAGLGLASEGLALKMVVMQFIQVNVTAYVIARIWNWPFDWLYQPFGLLGCLGLGWVVNIGATSLIGGMLPWFVTLFVSALLYFFLVVILVYIMPWLIDVTRREIDLTFNMGLKKLQSIINYE